MILVCLFRNFSLTASFGSFFPDNFGAFLVRIGESHTSYWIYLCVLPCLWFGDLRRCLGSRLPDFGICRQWSSRYVVLARVLVREERPFSAL